MDTLMNDEYYEENLNSNLTLKSLKLPLPSLSQHMISSFENFRVKMDVNVNRSSEQVKCKDEEEKEDGSMSDNLMNDGNEEENTDTKSDVQGIADKDNVLAESSELTPEKDVNNNTVVKSTEIPKMNTDEENSTSLNSSANSKITEIWLSTEKSFPLDDKLSAESLTEIDENNNNISPNVGEIMKEVNQEVSNAVKSTVTKILQIKSQDQVDTLAPETLSPTDFPQNNNNNRSNNLNFGDEETEITWDQNIPITPTPSGALLNPEEYFYNSSEESDIELTIKIPKMAFAQRVLDELSEVCSTFTITSIGMPEKKKRQSAAKDKNDPNTQENPETVSLSIKPVPKPYTNIFAPSEDGDKKEKAEEKKKEISQLFFNFKGKRDVTKALNNKNNVDSDSSFPNSPATRFEDMFLEKDNGNFYCNPDDYISPPSPSFIIGVQDESRLTSKFPIYHQKFNPNKSTIPAKRSASTITEPVKDWDFWKNFVEHPPASADGTQTKFNRWDFSRTSFTETQEPSESTKTASGSRHSSPNPDDTGASSNHGTKDASSTTEIQFGVENQPSSTTTATHRTLSEVNSWRKFTLSSGYSEININQLEIQYDDDDVSRGNIFTTAKGENKILSGITKSECKVEGGLAKKIEQQCTSETSLSSASEIVQKAHRQNPSKQRKRSKSKSKTRNNNSKFKTRQLKEICPMEGAISNLDNISHNGKYLHSSSSCFSLSDEDGENETGLTRSTVKEGVFPLIINEKEKKLSSSSSRGHFVGDSLEKCRSDIDIDEKDYEYDKHESHPDEEKKRKPHHNNNNNSLMVKKHSPTSIKSSQGSLYSVGASLPPKPSVIRSSLSSSHSQSLPRSPRRGRFIKNNTSEGGGTKGLVTLNKVSSSTLSSKRSGSVGSRSSSGFEQCEKMATMKQKFDYTKIHECDSLHLLRLSRQEVQIRNHQKESSPIPSSSSNPVNSSASSMRHSNNYDNVNIKYEERKRSRTVPTKSTPKNQHVREKLHKRIFGFFKWCQVKGS